MSPTKTRRTPANTTIRLPVSIDNMWSEVADKLHMSKTTIALLALKSFAEQHGVQERDEDREEATV